MKAIARSYFWWGGLDKDIEELGKSCQSCQANQSNPTVAPLHPWVWPDAPWKRIHVDFAGPFQGHTFFIAVDAYSKWPEVVVLTSTTSVKTIEVLRSMFAHHGLPEQLVSDNGPQFTSTEFAQFMEGNRIKHILSAPYHASSNGLAERFVQTLKRTLKTSVKEGKTIHHRLAEFLFEYRATPHGTTNISPSELFLKRKLRTRFDLMILNTREHVTAKQADQKLQHDRRIRPCSLFPGSLVMIRDYNDPSKWIPGVVIRKLGPVTYDVETTQGRTVKRHIDQIRLRNNTMETTEVPPLTKEDSGVLDNHQYSSVGDNTPTQHSPTNIEPERRYPQRMRRPPDRCFIPNSDGQLNS